MLNEEEENQITRGRQREFAKRAPIQLGRTVWDDVFGEDNLELPSTGFMEKVKQAVTKNDYQQLMKEILNELQDKRDQFCKSTYPTLKEARNELYTMMTEIIVQEAGSTLYSNIMIKQDEINIARKLSNKIEYKTSRAKVLSASKSNII